LILDALERGQWWLVFAIVLSSLLAVIYVWRFVEVAYFRPPPADRMPRQEAPLSMLVPACLLIAATVWFGLDTTLTADSASRAAYTLFGGSQ
jgi:multicomponent Na+:H+ antiporter subunit D